MAESHASVGWQVVYATAKYNAVWINIPVADGQQEQYVMNTITKAWSPIYGLGVLLLGNLWG
jgi:hypothetical protein